MSARIRKKDALRLENAALRVEVAQLRHAEALRAFQAAADAQRVLEARTARRYGIGESDTVDVATRTITRGNV